MIAAATSQLRMVAPILVSLLLLPANALALTQSPSNCTVELVLVSPCLSYISSPPNNLSATPPDQCCSAFSSSLNSSATAICLCYLVQQPSILGFPVNGTRVLSLPSVCPLPEDDNSTKNGFLGSLCSGSPALPPLRSPRSSEFTHPSASDSNDIASPPQPEKNWSTTFPKTSPITTNLSVESATVSSATKQLYSSNSWFPRSKLIFFVPISAYLYSSYTLQ